MAEADRRQKPDSENAAPPRLFRENGGVGWGEVRGCVAMGWTMEAVLFTACEIPGQRILRFELA